MLFTCFMRRRYYLYGVLVLLFVIALFYKKTDNKQEQFSEKVKVALRIVGNQLLLAQQDSTSLVLPVIELEPSIYQIAFENELTFNPASLVTFIDDSFQQLKLPENYRTAVIRCVDKEVAYSYEMNVGNEITLIPCGGRLLPRGCYTISIRFINLKHAQSNSNIHWYLFLFLMVFFCIEVNLYFKNRSEVQMYGNDKFSALGSFRFYPEQNKLIKEALEISLSKKEGELLAIFVTNQNKVVKRDELTKKVWEDHGVIVGRSLDTYISKLRKKLESDVSIKITNVHGIGYKLEIIK